MIQKRKRKELYDKFRQGAIPSGADFADFIRSQLNLLDDGIDVSEKDEDPISLVGHGEEQNYLDFSDEDKVRRWRISGTAKKDPEDPEEPPEGFNIKSDNRTRMYIDHQSGNVGVNTDRPDAKVHIVQNTAVDALRIDDDVTDTTPFIINSDGYVGVGIDLNEGGPKAMLHVNNGDNDILPLRVDDSTGDTNPFVVDKIGNVGIGTLDPAAKLSVNGNALIGTTTEPANFGNNDLYVDGDIKVGGGIIVEGPTKGLELNGPLSAAGDELSIEDDVALRGNLHVEGNTTLGTYDLAHSDTVTINGRILSGGIAGGDQQHELVINNTVTVNRNDNTTTLGGNVTVDGTITSGHTSGKVEISDSMNISEDLNVNGSFRFDGTGHSVSGIVTAIDNDDDAVLPTEGAVKTYVDGQITGLEQRLAKKATRFHSEAKATARIGSQKILIKKATKYSPAKYAYIPYFNDHVDFYPPGNYEMKDLQYYSVSLGRISSSSGDVITCSSDILANCIRVYVQNKMRNEAITVNFYGLWGGK